MSRQITWRHKSLVHYKLTEMIELGAPVKNTLFSWECVCVCVCVGGVGGGVGLVSSCTYNVIMVLCDCKYSVACCGVHLAGHQGPDRTFSTC